MPGHIGIGAPGAIREYMIENLNLYAKAPANQFAAKLSTGGGNYDDLQSWSYFVMDDWRGGTNKKDPEGGGFLYGELETRYPNRLTLPNALSLVVAQDNVTYPLNFGWQPGRDVYPNSTLSIGTTQAVQQIAHGFNGFDAESTYVTTWLTGLPVVQVTIAIYSSTTSGGRAVPNALIASANFYTDGKPGAKAYTYRAGGLLGLTNGTTYHVVIKPTTAGTTLVLPITTTGIVAADEFSTYNGSVWTGGYTAGAFLHGVFAPDIIDPDLPARLEELNSKLYTVDADFGLWGKASDGANWISIDTLDAECTDMVEVAGELWIAQGSANNIQIMDAAESITPGSVAADLLLRAGGYVWRTLAGDAYYTADGSTWTGPIQVTWGGYEIRAIAALNDYIYCACDDGLYYIGFGDEVNQVAAWPTIDATNGVGMITHQGTLFIPLQQSIWRYDGENMLPVGFDMGEGLPSDRVGTVAGLMSLNNWLIAYLSAHDTESRSTVWAYNDQGWHYLAGFPYGTHPLDCAYDIDTRRLYFIASGLTVWQLPVADSANFNNVAAYPMPKMPNGFMETDWFFGNLFEVYKDMESIYVTGDDIDSTHTVTVYWKDDDSTDWETLGVVSDGREELRWDNYTTRPNTRQLKVGVLLTTSSDDAPIVRAIRTKYHPMVSDWFRWSFPILCSTNQEVVGYDVNTYTRAEMEAHLDEMIKRVPPFIFRDLDSTLYEVKVTGCQIQVMDYEYLADGANYNSLYNISIEQIRPAEYTA